MSAAAVSTYKGKIDRGTMTLAQIDSAEKGKLVTAAEAQQLRDYWHAVYDVRGLALTAQADRTQLLTWTAPTGAHNLQLIRTVDGTAGAPVLAPCAPGRYMFAADTGEAEAQVSVAAVVSNSVNGYLGTEGGASAGTTVPAAPAPEPASQSAPAEPGADAEAGAAVADDGTGTATS